MGIAFERAVVGDTREVCRGEEKEKGDHEAKVFSRRGVNRFWDRRI